MTDPQPDAALERARQRVKELKDFYTHLLVYVAVNTLLVVIDLADTPPATPTFLGLNWAYWPIFGWGIAIVAHAISVFFRPSRWEERKLRQYLEQERRRGLESR